MEKYESKAIVTSIRASSRASIKVNDSFYTVEWTEERSIPDIPAIPDISDGVDIEAERAALWETANTECDKQVEEILKLFNKK